MVSVTHKLFVRHCTTLIATKKEERILFVLNQLHRLVWESYCCTHSHKYSGGNTYNIMLQSQKWKKKLVGVEK